MSFIRRLKSLFRPAPAANAAFLGTMRAGTMPAGPVREEAERDARKQIARVKEKQRV